MSDIHILMTMIAGLGIIMMYLHQGIMKRFDAHDQKFDKMEVKFDSKFMLLQETVTDMDRRLCRLEGAFASKDYCVIKESKHKQESA